MDFGYWDLRCRIGVPVCDLRYLVVEATGKSTTLAFQKPVGDTCTHQGSSLSWIILLDPVKQRSTSPGRALPGLGTSSKPNTAFGDKNGQFASAWRRILTKRATSSRRFQPLSI
ncbi:hypothetical protein IGI04_035696 [Brassica rapa subsp. trilocularis]|uniref:Uncharacterized protein n=1 Tax=Brassica rapa subsp. trilocularis TaxID=1813537 RepID=A0ABQ7LCC2_BRACM|nr:hypothetical protein IGI04_035696 [Brassica rapa subsp. trilocularis]